MFVRVRDGNGNWSISNRTFFYKPAVNNNALPIRLVKAEYFVDADPGFGNGIPYPVSPAPQVTNSVINLTINGLSNGAHKLFIRALDENGIWSITNKVDFTVTNAPTDAVITATGASKYNLCEGETITVGFQAAGTFNNGNSFTAQLSDKNGSFGTPLTIGNLSGTASGSIICIIPGGLVQGTGYRVRVVSSNPVFQSGILSSAFSTACLTNTAPTITLVQKTDVSCFGANNGAIDVSVSGGNAPNFISWEKLGNAGFGSSNEDLTGLVPGTYRVTVTDAFYNAASSLFTVTGPSQLAVSVSKTDITCSVAGSATLSVNGGTAPYSILWSNGATGTSITGVAAGTYNYTITDNNNCNAIGSVTIIGVANSLNITATGTNVNCFGGTNGTATVNVTGAVNPVSYLWSNGAITQSISGLVSGIYTVAVTDANGCAASESVIIIQPTLLMASAVQVTSETCAGINNGSATVTASGGIASSAGNYRYIKLSIASSWAYINSPAAGNIVAISELKIRWDGSSRFLTGLPVIVQQGSTSYGPLSVMTDGIAETSNSLNIIVSSMPFSFYVDLGTIRPVTGIDIAAQAGGYYNLPGNFQVFGSNDAVYWQLLATENASSNAGTGIGQWPVNGYYPVTFSASGNNYTYLWDNGQTTATAVSLSPGNHTVTVTDGNNCQVTSAVTIATGAAIPLSTITLSGTSTLCQGETVTLTANEATSYLWSNGAITQSITVGNAGSYFVTVTNAAGCSATSASVSVNVNPAPVWFIDNDEDGYGTGTWVQSCTQPAKGFLAINLNSTTGDCDDNNSNINSTRQYISYSTNPAFANKLVDVMKGTSYTNFRFEADYFDANNQLPLGSYPRVILDYEGNGVFTDANDRMISMVPEDANDLNTMDGKRYVVDFAGLPYGTNYQTRIVVNDANNCGTSFGPFNYPDVLQQPNVQIFANDIKFSKFRTNVGETITITADVHNTSDQPAENFVVKLQSQYNPGEVFANQTIGYLSPYGKTSVSWQITTPAIPAWVPIQVIIDQTDVVEESNELDNSAMRPYVNGDYAVPGNIVTTSSASPSVINLCYSNTMSLSGSSVYTNTAVTLPDPGVAGATVDFTIVETGATYSGYTNSLGQYLINFPAPPPGTYQITGTVTDYTLTGSFTASFSVINQCPVYVVCPLPNLDVQINLAAGSIVEGSSINGTVTLINNGIAATTVPTVLALSLSGGASLPQTSFTVPPLAPGASYIANITNLFFNSPGYFTLYANADATQVATECNEADNYRSSTLEVRPNRPDIRPYSGPIGSVYNCPNPATSFTIENIGGVAAGAFDVRVRVKLGASVVGTYTHQVPGMGYGANRFYSFTVPHAYTTAGIYSYEIECDIEVNVNGVITELREDNNTATYLNAFTVFACKPDLYVQNCATPLVAPVNPSAGGMLMLNAEIANGGNAATTAPFTVRFTYSSGEVYNVVYNSVIAAGQSATVSTNAPAPASPGVSLIVTVDAANEQDELSEANNNYTGNLCHELQPVPTCNGALFASGPSVLLYSSATPWVPIRTNGLYLAQNVKVKFEVSGPGITGTQNLGTMTLNSILNNCNCPTIVSLNAPFAFNELGTYTFTFTVDPNNEFAECNEGNNVLQTQIIVVNNPDMRILSQYINPTKLNPAPGEAVTFNVTYENLGRANVADNMKLKLQVNGINHDEVMVGGLVQGDKKTITIPLPWSSNIYGAHIVRAIIDADNQVVEMDEINNEATRAIIVGKAANLYFHSFASSNPTPVAGEPIQLISTIRNEGDQDCTAKVQFFFRNSQGEEVYIGEAPLTIEAKGETTVSVPWNASLTGATLTARIVNVSVLEFNTNDNEATTQIGTFGVILVATDAACPGGIGSLLATASGGSGNYSYVWSNLRTGGLMNAVSGSYMVTVTDIETGQQVSATGTINANPDALPPIVSNCPGNIVSPNPVVTWVPPSFSDNCSTVTIISSHQPGSIFPNGNTTVTYTGTDAAGNQTVCSFVVNVPTYFVSISGTIILECFGSRTGSLTAIVNGGRSPFIYLWSNGRKTATISGLGAGTYSVTVTDANLITTTSTYTILQPAKVSATFVVTMPGCNGGTDGIITVSGTGGTPGYTYSINGLNYQSETLFENLSAGIYSLRIKDANNCSGTVNVTVRQPGKLMANPLVVVSSCYGSNTGSISLSVSGGNSTKYYAWTGPNGYTSASRSIKGLVPGEYFVTVTDINGCATSTSATVGQYNEIFTNPVITANICRGGTAGAIELSPTGGSGAGFTQTWRGPGGFVGSSEDIQNLLTGNYNLSLTDVVTKCVVKQRIIVGQPALGITVSTVVTPVSRCGGTGKIQAGATLGTLPYQFKIGNGAYQNSGLFDNLPVAAYVITAMDGLGCTSTKAVNVTDNGSDAYETNNSLLRTRVITLGQLVEARIGTATDQDWFKFTTSSGNAYKVTMSHASVAYSFNVQTNAGVAVAPTMDVPGIKSYTLLPNTIYVVHVTGAQSLICYNLKVEAVAAPEPIMLTSKTIEKNLGAPKELSAQVYPNPHEGNFIIEVESPVAGEGTIVLYDLQGRAIAERNELLRAGSNQLQFTNQRKMSFVYRVLIGGQSVSGKVLGVR